MSLIAIEGMKFYAHHGYYQEERILGGFYIVDVYVKTNFEEAAEKDMLAGTINYEEVFNICEASMKVPVQLIEHVGNKMIKEIITISSNIQYVKLRLSKLNPPLQGQVTRTFVEIEKTLT